MTQPIALLPPAHVDVDEYRRRLAAALAEVGCYCEFDGDRMRFRASDEPTIRQAQRITLDSMGIPYEIRQEQP